jgi:polyhydroxybutyrate depolymerase
MGPTNLDLSWRHRAGITRTISVGGLKRTYVAHAPKEHVVGPPVPVVVALHGATMNGPMMASFTGLNHKADEAGFIAIYPDGTGTNSSFFWNGGNCCGPAREKNIDDVAFIDSLLNDLMTAYAVDSRAIYATGMSNGAVMAYRLAAELSNRIAAIAPVAGAVGFEPNPPGRPVSVLHFHGSRDEYVPFLGGIGANSPTQTDFCSVEQSIQTWVKANGCSDSPRTDVLSEDGDGLRVTRTTYGGGRDGTEVSLVAIEGGGHTWPGMKPTLKDLGPSTLKISANDLMWEFFQKHRLT